MAQITVFVQCELPGMPYGDIVTLEHTDYVDVLIAGGRMVPTTDPIFRPLVATVTEQPQNWSLLDSAISAASPIESVTPATAVLNQVPVDGPAPLISPPPIAPAFDAPADVRAETPVEAPVEESTDAPADAPAEAPAEAPIDPSTAG